MAHMNEDAAAGAYGVVIDIIDERHRQDALWGQQNHAFPRWLAILQEEIGEAAKTANDAWTAEGDDETQTALLGELRRELVQAAAVATAMIECLDRIGERFIDQGGDASAVHRGINAGDPDGREDSNTPQG